MRLHRGENLCFGVLSYETVWEEFAAFFRVEECEGGGASSSVDTPLIACLATQSRNYRVADKSLARPGRKQTTATEDFDVHISYL